MALRGSRANACGVVGGLALVALSLLVPAKALAQTVRDDAVDWAGSEWNTKVKSELDSLIMHARRR